MKAPFSLYRSGVGVLLALVLGLLAACGDTATPTSPPATPLPTPAPAPTVAAGTTPAAPGAGGRALGTVTPQANYSLRVTRDGQVLKELTAAEISGLPQQAPDIGGRPMSGARCRAVLALAGIMDAQTLTIHGTDSTRSGPATVTLPWSAITDDVLLGINQRGATKFFGANLPGEQWVVDVTEIEVK